MKKYLICLLVIGIVFSYIGYVIGDVLISSKTVSYETEYTDKTNVSDALDELISYVDDLGEPSNVSLHGGEPVIKDNLIPVIIKRNGAAVKADTTKRWYDYGNKVWANAVELVSNPSKTYDIGDVIKESDIRSYFVWIPKYRYKLWNVNIDGTSANADHKGPFAIEIEFNQTNTTDVEGSSCATPMTSNGSGNCDNGEWMTHPAFISMNVTGFWVGKFEIGHKDNNTTVTKTAMNPASDAANIVVKPDYYSWTNTTSANYFNTMLNYNSTLDSHMIKNTEWGAVAYLSHSQYGINDKVNNNNNVDNRTNWHIKTGYSANPNTNQQIYPAEFGINKSSLWNTRVGYRASTTGNISGIYDMSGGAHEYMSAFRTGISDITSADSKYYDVYGATESSHDYKYRILGDATGEMGPFKYYKDSDNEIRYHGWYGERTFVLNVELPWYTRGGQVEWGFLNGLFSFSISDGNSSITVGSRLVLSPTK